MRRCIHTIPVPRGWSPEQAWEAIARGVELTDPEPAWANVFVVDGRYVQLILPEDTSAKLIDPAPAEASKASDPSMTPTLGEGGTDQ